MKFLINLSSLANARWGLFGRNIMENAMIIAIIIALIVIVLLMLELKKSSNTVKILKEKANYWQYRSDAKEYLLL